MRIRDAYLHGTDQVGVIKDIKWEDNVLKVSRAVGSPSYASIGAIPTWNLNTTGSAAKLTTGRYLWGNYFNGESNVTGTIAATKIYLNGTPSEYSANNTYTLNTYVTYQGKVYKCTTAIETKEAWTAGHWTEVSNYLYNGGDIYNVGTINVGHVYLREGNTIGFRDGNSSYHANLRYDTAGNEALILGMKSSVTSFIIKSGDSGVTSAATTSGFTTAGFVPSMQVKGQSLYVNELIANGVTPTYNFKVNGKVGITTSLSIGIPTEYSASSTYSLGDIVSYQGQSYRAKQAISTAEAWTASHWDALSLYSGGTSYIENGLEIRGGFSESSFLSTYGPHTGGYANLLLRGDATYGISGISFTSSKKNTTINQPSDGAFIQFKPYGCSFASNTWTNATSGELAKLIIGVSNDEKTDLVWIVSGMADLKHVNAAGVINTIPSTNATTTTAGLGLVSTTTAGVYTNTSAAVVLTTDSRLSDARTPSSHTHGNITNGGLLGTASVPVVTDANKAITTTSYTSFTANLDVFTYHATTAANNKKGLVPAPTAGSGELYLRSDGTWLTISTTDTTYTIGTGDAAGLIKLTPSSGTAGNATVNGWSTVSSNASNGNTAYGYFTNGIANVANGGTGKSSWTKSGVVYASDTTALDQITNPDIASKTWYLKATTDASKNISYEWIQVPTSIDTATYASNVGSSGAVGSNYVTASKVISACNWYDTMINESDDADTKINRWKEVVDFLDNFTESDDLASILSRYVTLNTTLTISGLKTFSLLLTANGGISTSNLSAGNTILSGSLTVSGASTFSSPISCDSLLGNATTADRWKNAIKLSLTGSVTGEVSIDGSGNVTLNTTTNHNHNSSYMTANGIFVGGNAGTSRTTSALTNGNVYINSVKTINGSTTNTGSFKLEGAKGIEVISDASGNLKVQHTHTDITAKTSYGSTATTASANGGSFTVTDVQYDAQGHITGSTDRTITLSLTTSYLPLAGGTLTGAVTFANGTYNTVGDDSKIGDINVSGTLGLKGANGTTALAFVNKDNNYYTRLVSQVVTSNIDITLPNAAGTLLTSADVSGGGSSWGSSITVNDTTLTIPAKPTYTSSDVGLGNVSNTAQVTDIAIYTGKTADKNTDKSITTNGDVYIKLNKTVSGTESQDSLINIKGAGSTTVTTDANGAIVVTGGTIPTVTNYKWANLAVQSSAAYNTSPEFGSVKIGNGSSTTATSYCKQEYDATNKCLKFIFN